MPATCWSSIGAEVMRATRLDSCGAPVEGPCSTVVSDGFVSIGWESEIKDGTEVEIVKANGRLCISDKACDEIKWINLTFAFCQVNPDLVEIMTGFPLVLDQAGTSVGNRVGRDILCQGGFALEAWTRVPEVECVVGVNNAKPWGYFLAPWVKNAILTGFTMEDDGASFEITARTEIGGNWGVGPYDVDAADAINTPGPLLTPIGPREMLDMHLVTVQPPVVDPDNCGCTALVIP